MSRQSSRAGHPPTGFGDLDSALIVLPFSVADGAANMATDEAMMELARDGRSLLRFYGWEPWCLSLGRNQAAPARLLGQTRAQVRVGVDAVRRPTGGRSVYHGPEITYAFTCPDRAWGGPRAVYRRIHGALAEGLSALGVDLDRVDDDGVEHGSATGSTRTLAPSSAGCFRDPAPGELTFAGRKLVGSAQWRRRGALLQHGSILLQDHQGLGELCEAGPPADAAAIGAGSAIGLDELLERAPEAEAVVPRLTEALERGFGASLGPDDGREGALPAALDDAARRLEPRYRSPQWLWRRAVSPWAARIDRGVKHG